jgi:hypothetical protein
MTLAGFKSRCRTALAWAYASVCATFKAMSRKRGRSAAGSARSRSKAASVRPLTSFMVKNGRAPKQPQS